MHLKLPAPYILHYAPLPAVPAGPRVPPVLMGQQAQPMGGATSKGGGCEGRGGDLLQVSVTHIKMCAIIVGRAGYVHPKLCSNKLYVDSCRCLRYSVAVNLMAGTFDLRGAADRGWGGVAACRMQHDGQLIKS